MYLGPLMWNFTTAATQNLVLLQRYQVQKILPYWNSSALIHISHKTSAQITEPETKVNDEI